MLTVLMVALLGTGRAEAVLQLGPTEGPHGFEIAMVIQECTTGDSSQAQVHLFVDGRSERYWYNLPTSEFFATFSTWMASMSVGTHQLSFQCRAESRDSSRVVWRDPGFSVTITEPQRVTVAATKQTAPGLRPRIISGAPAGPEPCPQLDGVTWETVVVWGIDPRVTTTEGEGFSVDGESADTRTGFPTRVAADLPTGSKFGIQAYCMYSVRYGFARHTLGYMYGRGQLDVIPLPAPDLPACPGMAVPAGDRDCDGRMRMAMLGDSYSSGEGLLPEGGLRYDCGTDMHQAAYRRDTTLRKGWAWTSSTCDTRTLSTTKPPGIQSRDWVTHENMCHRHGRAYPQQVRSALGADGLFVACSGAVTSDVSVGQYRLSPVNVHGGKGQLPTTVEWSDHGGAPDIVTIGIGGNDGEFSGIIEECMAHACLEDTAYTQRILALMDDVVFLNVRRTLQRVRDAFPKATVVAFGYPSVVGDPAIGNQGADCFNGFQMGWRRIEEPERRWLKETVFPTLTTALRDAAIEAGVSFVDISKATTGNEICSGKRWINGLQGGDDIWGVVGKESFHPNQKGHAGIASWFLDESAPAPCASDAAAQGLTNRTCSFVRNGVVSLRNPAPRNSGHQTRVSEPIVIGRVRAGATIMCGFSCLQPAACIMACPLRVQGSGFTPTTRLRITLSANASGPTLRARENAADTDDLEVGTIDVDSTGAFDSEVQLPHGTPPGVHALSIRNADPNGPDQRATALIQVFETAPPEPEPVVAPSPAQAPTISGTGRVGSPMSCTPGTWSGTGPFDITSTWLRDGQPAGTATGPYLPTASDVDAEISCQVNAANDAGNATATSSIVRVIPAQVDVPGTGPGQNPNPGTGSVIVPGTPSPPFVNTRPSSNTSTSIPVGAGWPRPTGSGVPQTGPTFPTTQPQAAATVSLASKRVRRSGQVVQVQLRCLGAGECAGKATLRTTGRRPRVLASASYAVHGGARSTARLRLNKAGRSALITRKKKPKLVLRLQPSVGAPGVDAAVSLGGKR